MRFGNNEVVKDKEAFGQGARLLHSHGHHPFWDSIDFDD
jgi:hypothetical protein